MHVCNETLSTSAHWTDEEVRAATFLNRHGTGHRAGRCIAEDPGNYSFECFVKLREHEDYSSSYLDALLVVHAADHPHAHLRDLAEGGLLQTNVPQDLDHPLPDADAGVLGNHRREHV